MNNSSIKILLASILCCAFLQTHVLACNGTVCKPGPTIYAYDENGNVIATAQGDPSCAFGIEGPAATPGTPAPSHKKHRDRERILAFAAVMAVGVTVSIAWGKSHERKAAKAKVSLFATGTNGSNYEFSRR